MSVGLFIGIIDLTSAEQPQSNVKLHCCPSDGEDLPNDSQLGWQEIPRSDNFIYLFIYCVIMWTKSRIKSNTINLIGDPRFFPYVHTYNVERLTKIREGMNYSTVINSLFWMQIELFLSAMTTEDVTSVELHSSSKIQHVNVDVVLHH